MDVCVLWMLFFVRQRYLRRDDYSSRRVLPNVVCLNMIMNPQQRGGTGPLGMLRYGKKICVICCNKKESEFLFSPFFCQRMLLMQEYAFM